MATYDPPDPLIAEITLIGTGGGYGESCVIHMGNNEWIVVDSCINPKTKSSLPLEYLQELKVDVKKDVKLIVCTHWHDDHILGLPNLLEECLQSEFCYAPANDLHKFLRFVSLDFRKLTKIPLNSSTTEFNKCVDIMSKRNPIYVRAGQDRILFRSNSANSIISEAISLSPSDKTLTLFDLELSTLIDEYQIANRKIISQSPNSKSVAIYLKLGNHRAILGSDLAVSRDSQQGWENILNNCKAIDSKSTLFKIPHHGSKNAYEPKVWTNLLEPNPVAKLTPWNRNFKLPEPGMLIQFCKHSENVYMTKAISSDKPKKRTRDEEKIISQFNTTLREVKFEKGIIRCRINLVTSPSVWSVEKLENAVHVNQALV